MAYFGDYLVTHMQAGGVAIAAPPTPVFLNVLGQKVGVEEMGHSGLHALMSQSWLGVENLAF